MKDGRAIPAPATHATADRVAVPDSAEERFTRYSSGEPAAPEQSFDALDKSQSPRQPNSGELLFEFVRERDHRHFRFELRFQDALYGWEVQLFEGRGFLRSHGPFATRALAERWAEEERKALEQ